MYMWIGDLRVSVKKMILRKAKVGDYNKESVELVSMVILEYLITLPPSRE